MLSGCNGAFTLKMKAQVRGVGVDLDQFVRERVAGSKGKGFRLAVRRSTAQESG
jgi:hypothetical protein